MDKNELLKAVAELGFPLLETSGLDVNKVLAEVVKSQDPRLWEGFPVLLRNAFEQKKLNAGRSLPFLTENERSNYWSLFCLAVALYQDFSLSVDLYPGTQSREDFEEEVKKWRNNLAYGGTADLGHVSLSMERVKRLFQDYYLSVKAEAEKKRSSVNDDMNTEYLLSQLFSPKQKELLYKKVNGMPLTKTEREYFSRTVKKKLLALANVEVHKLAVRAMSQ